MKSAITLFILLLASSLAFGQKNVADTTKKKDQKNTAVSQQVHITPGSSGVKRSIGYRFSSSTLIADPGNGFFRLDSEKASDSELMIVDDFDISGEDQTKWYSTWDKTTGATGRGSVTVADTAGKVVTVYDFTDVFTDADGFWKLPVKYVSGTLPSNGSVYYYVFERIAHGNTTDGNPQGNQTIVQAVVTPPVVVPPPVVEPPVVVPPAVVVTTPVVEVKDTVKIKVATQLNQTVVAVVVEPPAVVTPPVVTPPVEIKDTTKVKQTIQGNVAATVVTADAAAFQPGARTQVTQTTQPVRRQETTQPTQAKPVTQTSQPAQSKPLAQTTQPVQTKPVTQTTQPSQTKPVVQTPQPAQTKPATQTTQPAQQVQIDQAAQVNNQPPAKQYNQFPVVENIFQSPGSGRGHRKWYRGIIEFGYGLGLGDYGINNFRFNFINAIKIGDYASIGLGIGYRRYFTDNSSAPYLVSNVNQIPLFLDLRTTFSSKKVTPYLAIGVGTSSGYQATETDKDLFLFNGSGGIWWNISGRFAIFAGIAYELQKLQYSDTDPFADTYKHNCGSVSLNIGIAF